MGAVVDNFELNLFDTLNTTQKKFTFNEQLQLRQFRLLPIEAVAGIQADASYSFLQSQYRVAMSITLPHRPCSIGTVPET